MIRVNGLLTEPFSIKHSIVQGCFLAYFLCALALEPLMLKLERFMNVPHKLEGERTASACAEDVTVLVSDNKYMEVIGIVLKEYETPTRNN